MLTGLEGNVRYITHPGDLPAGARVLIYGAGGRGKHLLRLIKTHRPDLLPMGFLDTFKPGRAGKLPIHAASALPGLLEGPDGGRTAVVVASFYHEAISEELRRLGVKDYFVLLEENEAIPYLDIPAGEVVERLNARPHPLCSPRRDTSAREGRFWRCSSLSALYLRPTGFSLCCWMPDVVHASDPAAALSRLEDIRGSIVRAIDRGECAFCAACPELTPRDDPADTDKITLVHMDTSTTCNLDCAYCNVKGSMSRCRYDPEAVYDHLAARGLVADGFRFDWGGFGEPSINPHFAPITQKMLDAGGLGLVYTNALAYSPVIARGLSEGRLRIMCSIDAGTRETYRAVRNVDAFEAVWKNIGQYVRLNPEMVFLKYIVTTDNAAGEEVEAFADRCARTGARKVVIAKDFFIKRTPAGVREGVRRLALSCRDHGLSYSFLATAISPAFVKSLKLDASARKRSGTS